MRFLRCVQAEVLLVLPRLTRTRLGVSLLALGGTLVWLHARGFDPVTAVLLSGALGVILGAASLAGDARDHAALAVALTHPTTPLAIATGRWCAIVLPAAGVAVLTSVAIGVRAGDVAAGLLSATAVGSCALAAALLLGNGASLALFLFMAVAGTVPPEQLVDLARPGVLRLTAAGALELGPALWHYRDVAAGDLSAILHAAAWTGLGVLLASAIVGRHRAAAG